MIDGIIYKLLAIKTIHPATFICDDLLEITEKIYDTTHLHKEDKEQLMKILKQIFIDLYTEDDCKMNINYMIKELQKMENQPFSYRGKTETIENCYEYIKNIVKDFDLGYPEDF